MLRQIFLFVSNLPLGCNITVARLEVLTVVLLKILVFWNVTACHSLSDP
jgi:hypothetical protein